MKTLIILAILSLLASCEDLEGITDIGNPTTFVPTPQIDLSSPSSNNSHAASATYKISNLPEIGAVGVFGDSKCSEGSTNSVSGSFSNEGRTLSLTFHEAKTYNLSIQVYSITSDAYSECVSFSYTVIKPPQPQNLVLLGSNTGLANNIKIQYENLPSLKILAFNGSSCDNNKNQLKLEYTSDSVITVEDLPIGQTNIYLAYENQGGARSICSSQPVSYTREQAIAPDIVELTNGSVSPSDNYQFNIKVTGTGIINGVRVRLYKDSLCTQYVSLTFANSSDEAIFNVTAPPGETISYYATSQLDYDSPESECSTAYATYERNPLEVPDNLRLATGQSSPGEAPEVKITVSNLIPGNYLNIYKDNQCSRFERLKRERITNETMTITIDRLENYSGQTLSFYATQEDYGGDSNCSTSTVDYLFNYPTPNVVLDTEAWYPENIAGGDFNDDGHIDIVSSGGFTLDVFMGVGDGTFNEHRFFPEEDGLSSSADIKIFDVNQDGFDDIIIGNYNTINYFQSLGDGSFASPLKMTTPLDPRGSNYRIENIEVADINNDNKIDIIASVRSDVILKVLGNGDGTFQDYESISIVGGYSSFQLKDISLNGFVDLVTISSFPDKFSIYSGDGSGNFSSHIDIPLTERSHLFVISDYDKDSDLDIIYTGSNQKISILENSSGSFIKATGGIDYDPIGSPSHMVLADVNNDGNQDLILSNSYSGFSTTITMNNDTSFNSPVKTYQNGRVQEILVADFNSDGKDDLAKVNSVANQHGEILIVLQD